MGALRPTGAVSGLGPDPAGQVRPTLNSHDGLAEEGQRLKDMQLAILNILEDATADRLRAEAAAKASLNILEDLSDAQAEIQMLNAELEARVEQRTAELVVANKNLEAFTYSVAHDLRSPLRALSGYSESLTEDYGDILDETGRWYAERIQAATERMGALIDDLLLLAQVSRAEMNLGRSISARRSPPSRVNCKPASPAAGFASPSRTASGPPRIALSSVPCCRT